MVYVRVLVADDAGTVEMLDDRALTAHVEDGELLAFGSARPRTEECYDGVPTPPASGARRLWCAWARKTPRS